MALLQIPIPRIPVQTGVVFDQASSSPYEASLSTYTWSHTIGSASNRFLLVSVSVFAIGTVSRVRYNGVDLTFVRADTNSAYRSELWKLVAPTTGTNTIQVDLSASLTSIGSAVSYSNVDQVTPIEAQAGATGTGGTVTAAVTTLTARARVSGNLSIATASGITSASGQSPRNTNSGALGTDADADKGSVDTPASTSLTWSGAGGLDAWAISLVSLRPVQPPYLQNVSNLVSLDIRGAPYPQQPLSFLPLQTFTPPSTTPSVASWLRPPVQPIFPARVDQPGTATPLGQLRPPSIPSVSAWFQPTQMPRFDVGPQQPRAAWVPTLPALLSWLSPTAMPVFAVLPQQSGARWVPFIAYLPKALAQPTFALPQPQQPRPFTPFSLNITVQATTAVVTWTANPATFVPGTATVTAGVGVVTWTAVGATTSGTPITAQATSASLNWVARDAIATLTQFCLETGMPTTPFSYTTGSVAPLDATAACAESGCIPSPFGYKTIRRSL